MSESQRPMRGRVAAYGERSCGCCYIPRADGISRAEDKRHDCREIEEQIADAAAFTEGQNE